MEWISYVLTGIGILTTIVGGLLGYFIKQLDKKVDDVNEKIDNHIKTHETFKDTIPNVYARRDDTDRKFDQLISVLNRVEDKIDRIPHG